VTSAVGAALAFGALIAGVLVIVTGIVGTSGPSKPPSRLGESLLGLLGVNLAPAARQRRWTLIGAAAVALFVSWLYTGIPMVGLGAGAAVLAGPWLFGATRTENRMIARLEAVETWARRLADLVRTGAGLHQAIIVGAVEAPLPIRAEVAELATELRSDMSTVDALRSFADRLDDPTADEVIAALMLNARERGPRLADVLDRICESIADLVTMRREQSSSRTDARISAMILSGLTLLGLVVLVLNKTYMKPYHSLLGEMVLTVCLVAFAGLLVWCRQLNMPKKVPRLLRPGRPGVSGRMEES
jgi:tight adherence protein B